MSRIQGAGASDHPHWPRPPREIMRPLTQQNAKPPPTDSINLSDTARKLAAEAPDNRPTREARIKAARKKLLAGELDSPEAVRDAAEQLLRSGDLEKTKDGK